MKQTVVFLRGTACSGKTTISKEIRNFDNKIAWISIDKLKEIFTNFEDRALDEVHKSANVVLADLLDREYSVIVDGIFKKPFYYEELKAVVDEKNIPSVLYQLECSLPTLLERDKHREGAKIWGPLGDEIITNLYNTVKNNPLEGAIIINTEEKTLEECVSMIRESIN